MPFFNFRHLFIWSYLSLPRSLSPLNVSVENRLVFQLSVQIQFAQIKFSVSLRFVDNSNRGTGNVLAMTSFCCCNFGKWNISASRRSRIYAYMNFYPISWVCDVIRFHFYKNFPQINMQIDRYTGSRIMWIEWKFILLFSLLFTRCCFLM